MKILNEKPPVWDNVCAAFGINAMNAVFTYGDTLYNPSSATISDDLMAHESLHEEQQAAEGGPEAWWGKFLRDPQFRLEQESAAYGVQYAHICKNQHDRNLRARWLHRLASSLSGPLYNGCVDLQRAKQMIKNHSGVQ